MQRSRGFGHGVVVLQDLLQFTDCALMWLLQAFSLRGLEAGLPAFQLPMYSMCGTHCRKRFCSTCLFQEFRPFVKSKPPLPTSWAAARSTSSALWFGKLKKMLSVVVWECCKPTNNCRDWVFSNSGLEVGATSLSAAHVRTMWRAAERRFAQHACLRHIFRPFLFGIPSIYSLPEAGSRERQYVPPAPHYACITLGKDPIPLWKIPDLCVM